VARRHLAGADFRAAARELLDEAKLLPGPDQRERALAECPPLTGDPRFDAYLGALAEHLAQRWGRERPDWAVAPERFLDTMWFVSEVRGFRAIAIAQSPGAFRRRGIMIAAGALERC